MKKYPAGTWLAGCTSLVFVGACSPTGSKGANDAPSAYADGGFVDSGTTGGSRGGMADGGSMGDTTDGSTGDGAGDDRPKWCAGADTDAVEPPTYDDGIACTFCPYLNANTATGWEKDGVCSKARMNAVLTDLRNPGGGACAAARERMASTCCIAEYQPPRDPMRALCVDQPGPFPSTDLCEDGCFPSEPNRSLLYASSGAVGYWLNQQGDRTNTCLQNDSDGSDIRWTCKKVYYLLKFGHLPLQLAGEVAYWWNRQAGCGCDGQNTNNPDNQN